MIAAALQGPSPADRMRVELERVALLSGTAAATFGVGRRADFEDVPDGIDARVLVPLHEGAGATLDCAPAHAIAVPSDVSTETALLAPLVAEGLRAWDMLDLEVGATALIAGGGPWSPMMALIASWYGAALLTVGVDGAAGVAEGCETDFEGVGRWRATLQNAGRVSVVELSGRSEMVDFVLETVPRHSRVLFAGAEHHRLTIDFYANVHRKGLHLFSSILSPTHIFAPGMSTQPGLQSRVWRLLQSARRASACGVASASILEFRVPGR